MHHFDEKSYQRKSKIHKKEKKGKSLWFHCNQCQIFQRWQYNKSRKQSVATIFDNYDEENKNDGSSRFDKDLMMKRKIMRV